MADQTKTCSKCRGMKPTTEFYKNKAQPSGLDNNCKSCGSAARAASKRNHPETVRRYCKRWREKHKDYDKERNAQWTRDNPELCQVKNQRRRARKKQAPGRGVTREQWAEILKQHGYRCVYCKQSGRAQDHVVPLSRGGAHDIDNVVPACKSCNSSKKDKLLSEWRLEIAQHGE